MKKKNCWDVKKCGREYGGERVREMGVCPAARAIEVNGVHNGKNGGRCCWAVTGTMCGDKVQGMYAMKYHNCKDCEFYKMVHEEESGSIEEPKTIIKRLV